MKISTMWRLGSCALIGLASLISQSASAQVATADGDLILGFRATDGTGSSTNYVVNIGQASQYGSATAVLRPSLGNIGADLATIYGTNWYTRTDLV